MLSRRALLAIAVVVDIALLARGRPVAARLLAERQGRAPRHLEGLLQDLVRHGFLKGTRGPRGGYALARERRRISLGEIVRRLGDDGDPTEASTPARLIEDVVVPLVAKADAAYLAALDRISVEDAIRVAEGGRAARHGTAPAEFHI